MGPQPQGTSLDGLGPSHASLGRHGAPGEEPPAVGGSSRLDQGKNGVAIRLQEGLEPAPLVPQPQLVGQELGSRLTVAQLGPGHSQEARRNQAGLVPGTSVQSNRNANIGSHLEQENHESYCFEN
jgi:hypothetical protein